MANRYWVGGSGTWSSTASWSASSGGAGGQSVPSSTDAVFIDANSGTGNYTITVATAANLVSSMTITNPAGSGNTLTISLANQWGCTSSTNAFTFSSTTGAVRITGVGPLFLSSNVSISNPSLISIEATSITCSTAVSITWDFNGCNITSNILKTNIGTLLFGNNVPTTGSFTISNGTLNLNGYTLTCNSVTISGSSSVFRGAVAGSRIVINTYGATGTIFSDNGSTAYSLVDNIDLEIYNPDGLATDRTVTNIMQVSTGFFQFKVKSGTYALSILANSKIGSLDFTGFSGTWVDTGTCIIQDGALILSTGMTAPTGSSIISFLRNSSINTNGKTLNRAIYANGTSLTLSSDINLGASSFTFASGAIDLTNRSITCSAFLSTTSVVGRSLAFGTTGYIKTTGSGSVWNTNVGSSSNITITGTSRVIVDNPTGTAATITAGSPGAISEVNACNFEIISGSYSLTITGTVKGLNFTGFTGTWATTTTSFVIYGGLTLSATMTSSVTGILTFRSSSAQQLRSNGNTTFDRPLVFDGTGSWVLQDNFSIGSTNGTITHTAGTLDINSYTLTCKSFSSTGANTRALLFGGGNLNLLGGGVSGAYGNAFTVSGTGFNTKLSGYDTLPAGSITLSSTVSAIGAGYRYVNPGGSSFTATISDNLMTVTGPGVPAPTGNNLLPGQYVYACPAAPTNVKPGATGDFLGYILPFGTSGSTGTGGLGTYRLSQSSSLPISTAISMRANTIYPELVIAGNAPTQIDGNATFKNIRTTLTSPTALLITSGKLVGCLDFAFGNLGSGTSFTGTIGATAVNVKSISITVATGTVRIGTVLYGPGFAPGTRIVNQTGAGTNGGTGTYTISLGVLTAMTSGTAIYASNDCTLDSFDTEAGYHFIADPAGVKTWVDFIALKNSWASGGAIWYAGASSNDFGNNVNWFISRPTANFHLFT